MVMTSGQNEPVVDGTSTDATHSLFAEQFITVLRQNSILLSGEVLAHELTSRIQEYARRTGLKQQDVSAQVAVRLTAWHEDTPFE